MKTTTKLMHTPGPWKHDNQRDQVFSKHPDWEYSLICKIATGEDRHQEDSNARLIAAAPELLDALRECITEDGALAWKSAEHAGRRLEAISNIAKAAIAKAEGNA